MPHKMLERHTKVENVDEKSTKLSKKDHKHDHERVSKKKDL
jgi:hypothetical protein